MKKRKVKITNTGYLPNSPDRNNDMNIIPSNQITMKNVPFPILGVDNMGNQQMMMPGREYTFPGQYVTEIPMGKYQKGGQRRVIYTDPEEFKIANQAYVDSLAVYNAPETSYKRFQNINNLIENNKFEEARKLLAQEHPYERNYRRLTILNNREPEPISGYDYLLGLDPKNPHAPKYKKPETKPVLEELTHIEPRPIGKLPVSIPQLIPVDYSSYSKPRTIESFDPNYTQRSGQLKRGDYYYDNALKRWQYKPAEQEEVDYNRSKGAVKKQQGGGIYMGDYEFKDGGLVKYQKRGQVSFDEYMMEGLRPRPAVQESTYRSIPIIEQEKKDNAKGVTTKQKVQAAANRKKIVEEEKKEEIKKQLLDQGEIKPATEGTERLKNQFVYAMDQPLDAMGSLMQRGYVPQGNLNGDYETASPMSSVIGAFNPVSVIMDAGRVGRDLSEEETYTTWGGAGEGIMNAAGFLPFGSIVQKSKRILPINPSQKDLKDLYRNRLTNVFSDNITEEQARTLERRVLDYDPNTTSIKQNQQKLFDEATEFQDLWTYSKEGKKQITDYLRPTFDALNAEQNAIFNKRLDLKQALFEERSKIDDALSDPKNFKDFDKLNQRYNEIEKELQEVKNMGRDRFFEINSLLEDLDSEMKSVIYDKDFKRKAQFLIDAEKSNYTINDYNNSVYSMGSRPFDKSRARLVYLDETDPSFMSLSDESKEYLRNNYDRIGGVRMGLETITLGSKKFPQTQSYIVKEKLPRSITNPFKSKTKDVILDVKNIRLQDPDLVGGVNAHEIRHDTQQIGHWIDALNKYDDNLEYYTSHENNPIAKDFKKALVEPGLPKSHQTWKADPGELDAELSRARFNTAKAIMKEYGLSMEDAIKVLKEDRDDYTDYLIEAGNLNKHFKPETTQEEKRRLIKMLPTVVPAIGAGYVGSQLYKNQQQEPTYKQGGIYLGKYEFKDGGLVKYQKKGQVDPNTDPNQDLTYKDNPEWFDNRAIYSGNDRYDAQIRKLVYEGKASYNPATKVMTFLKPNQQSKVNETTRAYSKDKRTQTAEDKKLIAKDAAKQHILNEHEDFVKKSALATGVLAAPFAASAAPTVMGALEAPMIIAGSTVPQVAVTLNAGQALGALGAGYGITQLPNTWNTVNRAVDNPTTSNITDAATTLGVNALDFVGVGLGKAALSGTKNAGRFLTKQLPGSANIGPIVNNAKNLEELTELEKFARTYGYEFPSNLKRIAQSDELTNRTFRGLLDRHNTFARGVSTNWDEIEKRNPEILRHLEGKGFDLSTEGGSKAAAEYMATHIPISTGYGRADLNDEVFARGMEGLYTSNSLPTAEGYTYGNGFMVRTKRPTDFSSSNRLDWIEQNNPQYYDERLPKLGLPKDYDAKKLRGTTIEDLDKALESGRIDQETHSGLVRYKTEGEKEIRQALREKYNFKEGEDIPDEYLDDYMDDLYSMRDEKLKELFPTKGYDRKILRTERSKLDADAYDFLLKKDDGSLKKMQEHLKSRPYQDKMREVHDLGMSLGKYNWEEQQPIRDKIKVLEKEVKDMYNQDIQDYMKVNHSDYNPINRYAHYIHLGTPGEKVLEPVQSWRITPEIWENKSRGHRNIYTKKFSAMQMGGNTNIQNGIYLGEYEFKDGGLVKAQRGKEMPFDLPLKEQNVYLLPEYNQPRNPKTGEILPDPQRPNLGMGTGATEYKYTYGSDEGDIDVPSIVAGQYIGDRALDRYMLTGERFKTMIDPGSYSKFYDQTNRLGLMREKTGGSVRKVKIKSLPRKNQ